MNPPNKDALRDRLYRHVDCLAGLIGPRCFARPGSMEAAMGYIRQQWGGMGYEVILHFDEPVDVVEFESFSGLRQRVKAMISEDGVSWSKTSDGVPHLIVQRESANII